MEDSKLSELRNKIDAIDEQLLTLLSARANLVLEVGKHKHKTGVKGNYIRSGREARMIRELTAKGAGSFPKPAIKTLWRCIISASLGLESGLKVALPANAGFELHRVAIEYFGGFTEFSEYETDDEIINSIDQHRIGILTLDTGWWLLLAEKQHSNLKIFAKLADGIFAVGRLETEESGDDRTVAITHAESHAGHLLASHGKVKLVEFSGFEKNLNDAVVIGNYGL